MKKITPDGEYEVIGLEEPAEEYRVIRCRGEDTGEGYTILEFQDETLIKEILPFFYELWKSANWEECRECFVSDGRLCIVLREKTSEEGTSLCELLEAFYEQSGKTAGEGEKKGNAVRQLYQASETSGKVKDGDTELPEPDTSVFRERLQRLFRKWENVIQVVLFVVVYVAVVLLLLYGFWQFRESMEKERGPRYQTIGTLDLQ